MGIFDIIHANITKSITSVQSRLDGLTEKVADRKRAELRVGLNADGQLITPKYSESWLKEKQSTSTYHAPSGTPDLYHKGALHKSIHAYRRGYTYIYKLVNAPVYAADIKRIYNEPFNMTEAGERALGNEVSQQILNDWNASW